MEKELLIVFISSIISFIIFMGITNFINREFNIENIPKWLEITTCFIFILIFYYNRSLFFRSSIAKGVILGFIITLLWRIKNSILISDIFKTIFSFKFLMWIIVTVIGIYKKSYAVVLWNKYILSITFGIKPITLIIIIMFYIIGTTLLLFPNLYLRDNNNRFSIYKKVATKKKVFAALIGIITVFLSSGLIYEAFSIIE